MKGWQKVRDAISKLTGDEKTTLTKVVDEAEKEEKEDEDKATRDRKAMDAAVEERIAKVEGMCKDHAAKIKTHDDDIAELKKASEGEKESEEEEKKTADMLEEEAPDGTGDKARKAKDSALLDESFQATVSLAEIIAPGLHIAAFDSAAAPKKTLDAICAHRRKALGVAASTTDGASVITELRGGRVLTTDSLKTMDCMGVRTLFLGTAAAMRKRNTDQGAATIRSGATPTETLTGVAGMKKSAADFWGKK